MSRQSAESLIQLMTRREAQDLFVVLAEMYFLQGFVQGRFVLTSENRIVYGTFNAVEDMGDFLTFYYDPKKHMLSEEIGGPAC
jgi:hypothetical protein